jgi:small-conductance mechanosensitive channel
MLKTELLQKQENLRRWFFVFKLLLLIGLLFFQTQYAPLLAKWKIQFSLISAFIFYLTAVLLISTGRLILVFVYIRQKKRKSDFKDNFVLGINRIAAFLSNLFLFFAILLALGINADRFFTSITIVAAAIAIISKDYITNMINGLILMFSDQLSLNDRVKIGEQQGKIVDINFMNIVIENDLGDLVLIPNNSLLTQQVTNFSNESLSTVQFNFELLPQFGMDLVEMKESLKSAMSPLEGRWKKDSLSLQITDVKKDGILYTLKLKLSSLEPLLVNEAQSILKSTVRNWSANQK